MTASLLLALALHLAPADALAEAQRAFAAADYPRAEALALEAAVSPREGEALYLAGLARFRSGRPQQALEALDAAARAADRPERGRWLFNRGACLYALGRFAEAEEDLVAAAAADPSLAAVALADAGFAALDAGAPERAGAFAASARGVAAGSALALVEELEAALSDRAPQPVEGGRREQAPVPGRELSGDGPAAAAYREGLAAYDAGRFAEARSAFQRAEQLAPDDGRGPLMAGAAALRLGARAAAREDVLRALSLELGAADARIARDHLAEASYGLASRPGGFAFSAHVGAGFDGNVLQSGGGDAERAPVGGERIESAELLAGLGVAWRWRPRPTVALDVGYGVEQTAYQDDAAEDYGVQAHALAVSLEVNALPRLRLGAVVLGEASFTGRSDFRAVDAGPGAGAWLAFDASDRATTRLDAGWGWRAEGVSRGDEFEYLAGPRLEAAVTQQLRLGRVTVDASLRHGEEGLGTLTVTLTPPPLPGSCGRPSCPSAWKVPFASRVDTLSFAARVQLGRVQLLGVFGYAWRSFTRDAVTLGADLSGIVRELGRRRRHDERLLGGAAATFSPWRWLAITGRWDVAVNRSNVARGETGHDLDYDDKSYTRHAAVLDAAVAF